MLTPHFTVYAYQQVCLLLQSTVTIAVIRDETTGYMAPASDAVAMWLLLLALEYGG